MTDTAIPELPRRGRPRSEKARQAILHAGAELLLNRGLDAVSMDAVAEHAGVSKATIYRWWPTKEALALDAFYTEWAQRGAAGTDRGTLRADLLALLQPWVRLVRSRPYALVIGTLITKAHSDPAFAAEYVTRLVKPRRDKAQILFERAAQRGELRPGVRVDVALDLLYGALYHRLLHGHAPLTDRFVAEVIDMTLQGVAATPTGRSTP
ncbi:MAG: TetR/AcrR family transcriptional regulator [Jatrophihabitantaceae bacterium]